MAHAHVKASPSGVYPGIQFRPFLDAGAIANWVVAGDFNNDGHMDFVVSNGGTNDLWIYLGNGDGTFQLPQIIPLTKGLTPVYLAAADLRGIGVLDLIVAEFDTSTIGVLLGNGDGTFGFEQEYQLPQPPGALVVDDFNGDGKLDIVSVMVTVNTPPTLGVQYLAALLGDGTGSFGAPVITLNPGFYSTADSIVSGDVNNDGLPDVLITGPGLENSQVYLNAGDGTFTPGQTVIASGPFNIVLAGALGDVNGDGCLDALVADGNGYVWVYLGDCAGNFNPSGQVPMGDSNSYIALTDMNGDGNLDIVTVTIPLVDPMYGEVAGDLLTVAFGDGKGNFTSGRDYVSTGMSYSLAIADFNGDGLPDVVSASPDTDTATVYINDGTGGFGFPQGEWIGLPGVGVQNAPISSPSFADLNGDGTPDVLILDEGYNGEYFITTMLNNGTGTFAGPVPSDTGISIPAEWMGDYRLGDFRNSGHLDFVGIGLGANYSFGTPYILFAPGNGDGTFAKATRITPPGAQGTMTVGDFNGDGKLDFVTVGGNPNGSGWIVTTFLGNGDGTFRNGGIAYFTDSAENISRVFVGDFNRDGKLDILVYDTSNGYWTTSSNVWEFLGNGDGTFQAGKQLFSAFQPMTMADINGDSWLDIVRYDFMWPDGITETLGPATFTNYLDQPSGTFAESSSYAPYAGIPLQWPICATAPLGSYIQFGDPITSSLVADLNGDGKQDEIAFQGQYLTNTASCSEPQTLDTYAQILMGNGDGTFTPTYDVFDFHFGSGYPGYSYIFDGTTFSDLLEIDGGTSSMHLYKGGPAPPLQLALEQSQVNGSSGCGWVFLNVPSTSSTSITLSSTVPGVVLPPTLSVPAGALSQQFCYTLASSYNWHQVYDVQAQLGGYTAIAYGSQSYVVGFSEVISPNSDQVIYPTQSTAPLTVSLTSSQGYSSTVQLSCQGLPVGATCAFASPSLSVSPNAVASTTVVVNTTSSTVGNGPVLIVASDNNVTTRQSFNLAVQPLSVQALGNPLEATSPGTASGQILIEGIPPYTPSCSGLPAGVTCAFSGSQQTYPSQTNLAVSLSVPSGVATGIYPFSVQVVSGPETSSVSFTLYVSDFSLQAPVAANDWAPPGATLNVGISAQPINGFDGTVNVTCALDIGGSCTGGSFSVVGSAAPTGINLTVSVPSSAPLGAHTLTVTGTDGPLSHTAVFPFYIANYSGSLSQSVLTISQGGSGSITATLNATTGFADTLTFACSGTATVSCTFSPPTLQPTANAPQTTTIAIAAGYSAARVRASGGVSGKILTLALLFPFGILWGSVRLMKSSARRARLRLWSIPFLLIALSCGGGSGGNGGGGGGGGGSNTYTITVTATAVTANISQTIGTLKVTVTQ